MNRNDLPLLIDATLRDGGPGLRPLLACGHYGIAWCVRSQIFDCPDVALFCPICREERQMDLRLQLELMA
jgi:hypothetical protein